MSIIAGLSEDIAQSCTKLETLLYENDFPFLLDQSENIAPPREKWTPQIADTIE